jgi:putative oxidoreductase
LLRRNIHRFARQASVSGGTSTRDLPKLTSLDKWAPHALAVLRVVTALLFMAHGTGKLLGFPDLGFQPELFSLIGLAAILEIVGGALLVLGLFTRPVAFILSGQMAVAYFMAHAPNGFFPVLNQGESAVLFCFIFLFLVFSGPGAWSLDGKQSAA